MFSINLATHSHVEFIAAYILKHRAQYAAHEEKTDHLSNHQSL